MIVHFHMDCFYLQNINIANFAALSSSIFISRACSAWHHTPPNDVFKKPANLSFMYLAISKVILGEKLLNPIWQT